MAQDNADLLRAFGEDHAILGRGFHDLSVALRAKLLPDACRTALDLDRQAGAHIAFEEEHFYPALVPLLGEAEVDRLYVEHSEGLEVLRQLGAIAGRTHLSEQQREDLLAKSEDMERHIAECGELFEAIGRIPPAEQAELYSQLVRLREDHPAWIDYANRTSTGRPAVEPPP